jgi:putative transposase
MSRPRHQFCNNVEKWCKLDGQNRLPEIIQGVEFRGGIKHEIKAA